MTQGCDSALAAGRGIDKDQCGRVAYDAAYLGAARTVLARMLDYAVNVLGYRLASFWALFLANDVSRLFAHGDASVVAGRSGIELARLVVQEAGCDQAELPSTRLADAQEASWYCGGRSEEYWCGWALAYYQWRRALSFSDIEARVPIEDVLALYEPYHEMDERQFLDRMDEECARVVPATKLQSCRKRAGLSQSGLAAASGVPLRTIQQYEQRQKNINHARACQVAALAQALCCQVEDLLEPAFITHEMSF